MIRNANNSVISITGILPAVVVVVVIVVIVVIGLVVVVGVVIVVVGGGGGGGRVMAALIPISLSPPTRSSLSAPSLPPSCVT